jgi:hypothetical protein
MGSYACVGGFDISNRRAVRLLGPRGENQPLTTPFALHDLWRLDYEPERRLRYPHIEDVRVVSQARITAHSDGLQRALQDIEVCTGPLDDIFERQVQWTSHGSGYVNEEGGVPAQSICFWRALTDLSCQTDGSSAYYIAEVAPSRRLKYVGLEPAARLLRAGTLLRLSLARWWTPEDAIEERCYLQLSGWFTAAK